MEKLLELILDERTIELGILLFAIITPILCCPVGYFIGKRTKQLRFGFSWGCIAGAVGPSVFFLWKMYNAITDYFGLDTVKNLLVNLVVFSLIGVFVGLLLTKAPRRLPSDSESAPPD